MRYPILLCTLLIWLLSASVVAASYYLDTPHNGSNGMDCTTCHSLAAFSIPNYNPDYHGSSTDPIGKDWTTRSAENPEDTLANTVCLECHGEGSSNPQKGPAKLVHSSRTTGSATTTWSTNCTQCHDSHFQGQLDWITTTSYETNPIYLATGEFETSNDRDLSVYNAASNYTTIGISSTITARDSTWSNVANWKAKGGRMDGSRAADGSRGLILIPSVDFHDQTYEIIDVSANASGYLVLKVKGNMDATEAFNTGIFGVIYGQSIRSNVMPNGGNSYASLRDVKYFVPELKPGTCGGYVDLTPNITKPVGLCQVCHTATDFWRKDGSAGDHYPNTNCGSCHDVLTGGHANSAPTANGGADQNVATGSLVTLNGSGSSDANGDLLSYSWTFTSRPGGSSAALAGATTVGPTFTADVAGTYVVSLVVNDGKANSATDLVVITAVAPNHAPVSNAGPDQSVATGQLVNLNGSGSSDADGDPLIYIWSLVTFPSGANAALSGSTTVSPSFTAYQPGTYVISLVVNDGKENSSSAKVYITAVAPPVTYTYDDLNRLIVVSYGDSVHVEYQYDAVGNLTSVISTNAP